MIVSKFFFCTRNASSKFRVTKASNLLGTTTTTTTTTTPGVVTGGVDYTPPEKDAYRPPAHPCSYYLTKCDCYGASGSYMSNWPRCYWGFRRDGFYEGDNTNGKCLDKTSDIQSPPLGFPSGCHGPQLVN